MDTTIVSEILATRLATMGLPIAAENAKFTPTAGVLYLREQMLGDVLLHRPVAGGVRNTASGLWQVTIMAPVDGTRKPAGNAFASIEALYPVAWQGTKAGVTVTIRGVTKGPSFLIGDRYAVTATIDWVAYS